MVSPMTYCFLKNLLSELVRPETYFFGDRFKLCSRRDTGRPCFLFGSQGPIDRNILVLANVVCICMTTCS